MHVTIAGYPICIIVSAVPRNAVHDLLWILEIFKCQRTVKLVQNLNCQEALDGEDSTLTLLHDLIGSTLINIDLDFDSYAYHTQRKRHPIHRLNSPA